MRTGIQVIRIAASLAVANAVVVTDFTAFRYWSDPKCIRDAVNEAHLPMLAVLNVTHHPVAATGWIRLGRLQYCLLPNPTARDRMNQHSLKDVLLPLIRCVVLERDVFRFITYPSPIGWLLTY